MIDIPHHIDNYFGDLFEEFNMKIIGSGDNVWTYANGACFLNFSQEYWDIHLDISNNETLQPSYSLGFMCYSLLGTRINMHMEIIDIEKRIILQLEEINQLLSSDFRMVLSGDFSWSTKYLELHSTEIEARRKMQTIPRTHPIWKKYLSDDNSWKDDIKML